MRTDRQRIIVVLVALGCAIAAVPRLEALPIALHQGTATFSQTCCGVHSPDRSVDGIFSSNNAGWAIFDGAAANPQTAVWETATDVTATRLSFGLYHNFLVVQHLIGRFRLSVTSDDRSTFADGLDSGGDVAANWTVLTGATVSGPAGMSFTTQGDNSILVGGATPNKGTYGVEYVGSFLNVTGIRLEVLADGNLPSNGPGLAFNGNFVLTEITLDASSVPEPTTLFFLGTGLIGLVGSTRRRR